ncbi:MAG: MarR family winged helix-turn-helix transcriptional regulator [Candidatus Methanoplasma sp.]|jgi:DNA-binding MarR family transcriptional regulator|nr:MarR family winged helix-turn-helix transcriptional regulator [Candidatus Methanoplasma sp.]
MDYDDLAKEFIRNMLAIRTAGQRKHIRDEFHGEIFILFFIRETGGEAVPGQIGSALNVSSARIATALKNLENKGLITREIHGGDRRKIIVRLTPKGEDCVEEEWDKKIEKMKNILMALGEKDSRELVRIIGRLSEVL